MTDLNKGGLVPFAYGDVLVRVVEVNAAPWWVAGDVAKVLGYRETRDMTRNLDDDEAAPHNVRVRSANGVKQDREITIISESGLYHAILKSRRPEAKRFRKWVTGEVLPALRRSSFYAGSPAKPTPAKRARPAKRLALVDANNRNWDMNERRSRQIGAVAKAQELVAGPDFAKAVAYIPSVLFMDRDGYRRRQRRPAWWGDMAVRNAVVAMHRQMTIDNARIALIDMFGLDRAPGRSSIGRMWQQLDQMWAVN